jgi:sigma-B regulation protein RsbU (phosphoserine phosphatase)
VNILVADDNAETSGVLCGLLEADGHQVLVAEDGAEAWELFRHGDCRLVMLSWRMPGMDALELTRRIRADVANSYTYLLVVMEMELEAAPSHIEQALKAGADDVLLQPIIPAVLKARLSLASRVISMQETLERQFRDLDAISRRLKRDLLAAEQAQRALLPSGVPGVADHEFAWFLKSCDEVGGDTLNVFRLDEHHLCFYVLDVSGHGVASALLAVQVCRFLHPLMGAASLIKKASASPAGYQLSSPREVLLDLNALFPSQPQSMQFFTIAFGIYDLRTHRAVIASAGHPGPLLVRQDGTIETPVVSGHPIGFFHGVTADFSQIEVELHAGDRLLLYSDGASEAADGAGITYGSPRLGEVMLRGAGLPLQEALQSVVDEIKAWRQGKPLLDDVSLLAIGRLPTHS